MGYDIYIGNTTMEAVEQYDDEDIIVTPYKRLIKGETVYYRPVVRAMKLPEAPVYLGDEFTGTGNSRHPGYIGWHNFCEEAGFLDLFFNKEYGLMRKHPGHAELSLDHLHQIEEARRAFTRRYPHATPSYTTGDPVENFHLIRLLWLEWWIRWTLEHCEHPAIYNF